MKQIIFILILALVGLKSVGQDSVNYVFYGTEGSESAVKVFSDSNGLKIFGSSGGYQGQNSDLWIVDVNIEDLKVRSFNNFGGVTLEKLVDVIWDSTLQTYIAFSQHYSGFGNVDYDLRLDLVSVNNEVTGTNIVQMEGNQYPVSIKSKSGLIYVLFEDDFRNQFFIKVFDVQLHEQNEIEFGSNTIPADFLVFENNIFICGNEINSVDSAEGIILKLDTSGNLMNEWSFGGSSEDSLITIVPKTDSTILVIGASKSFNLLDDYDAWIFELSWGGEVLWNRHYGYNIGSPNQGDDFGVDAEVLSDGLILFGVTTSTFGSGEEDFQIFAFNDTNEFITAPSFGFSASEVLSDLMVVNDSLFYLLGTSNSLGNILGDILLVEVKRDLQSVPIKSQSHIDNNTGSNTLGELSRQEQSTPFFISETIDNFNIIFNDKFKYDVQVVNEVGVLLFKEQVSKDQNELTLYKNELGNSSLLIFSISKIESREVFHVKRMLIK